jgi:membrane protease YdiL (CAAX protease family)
MKANSLPPQAYEERISRVWLWPLYFVVLVPLVTWLFVRDALRVSEAVHKVVFQLLLVGIPLLWWLLKAAPRPFSLRPVIGGSLDRAGWRLMAAALFGLTCVRMVWWLSPQFSEVVAAARQGDTFSFSTGRVAPEVFPILATAVLVPIVEELIFRGTCFRKWRLRWGPRVAMLLSSAVFAALHFDGRVVATFLCGVTFVLLYTRTRSLWAPVIVHGINNVWPQLSYLWGGSDKLIYLDSQWQYGAFALLVMAGVGVWLHFVIKSWTTLDDPLPSVSVQVLPMAPAAGSVEQGRATVRTPETGIAL